MGYSYPNAVVSRNRGPASSFRTPKTLTPGPRLQQRGRRYYSSEVGRWISRDPIGERRRYSLYLFVRNNPMMWVDMLGLDPVGEWISHRYWRDWWWQLGIWDQDATAQRNDGAGNTMAQRTQLQMDNYYRELARQQTITVEWKAFTIPVGPTGRDWFVIRHGGIDFSDAGFWLNQAQRVEARGGTYELRCNSANGKTEIRNTKGEFRWFDRIDNNPSRNDPWYFWLFETANEIPEWLTGCDFDVEIDWQDNRNDVRELW